MNEHIQEFIAITTEAEAFEAAGMIVDAILMDGAIIQENEVMIEPTDIIRDPKTGEISRVLARQIPSLETDLAKAGKVLVNA